MYKYIICLLVSLPFSIVMLAQNSSNPKNKFEPENGQVIFFIGQDLEAVGGFPEYTNGYLDHFELPAGITLYTNLSQGDVSYGMTLRGLDGIQSKANWGAGDTCAQYYLDDKRFEDKMMAIGLSMVNHEKQVANGEYEKLILKFASWCKESKRPIFLRIGYEFDGFDWNGYSRKHFLKAWKRIHQIFKTHNVTNVAFVWQSKGTGSDQSVLEDWYPGDDYVDWCGYSYFNNPDTEMISFARKHQKPVFIAEACPVLKDSNGNFHANFNDEEEAKIIWKEWFVPFFETINNNLDVIKAFSYINVEWKSQAMWQQNSYFKNVDSRIQQSDYISEKWRKEIRKRQYILDRTE